MTKDAKTLLLMMIRDAYKNQSGKPSRATTFRMMKFVRENPEIQIKVNQGDWDGLVKLEI